MLEYVFAFLLAWRNGRKAQEKGHGQIKYRWITLGLWLSGEIVGVLVGVIIAGRQRDPLGTILLCGIAGVVVAALVSVYIVSGLPAVGAAVYGPWSPTHRTPPAGLPAWQVPDPSLPPSGVLPPNVDVTTISSANGWVLVGTADGWRGWVDGSGLVARYGSSGWR